MIELTTMMPDETFRVVDASLNRIGEGLRLLEDVARLMLNDAVITQQLKNMRHEIVKVDGKLLNHLIQARDSEGDIGINMEVPGEENQRDIPANIVANARRVQESLRVMEEIARLPELDLDKEKYKQARFALYTIEKALLSRVLRQEKIKRLGGLYVIIDTQSLGGRRYVDVASQAIQGGAKIIQLRDKESIRKDLLPIAQNLRDLCAEQDVLFIMNDYLDIALAIDADGLHVGQDDLPVKEARRLLTIDKILGCSVCTIKEAADAISDGADYIGVGCIYPTSSKEKAKVIGPERLREIKQVVSVPVVAIGGINQDNISEVVKAGVDAVAVISAVLGAENVREASHQLAERIESE